MMSEKMRLKVERRYLNFYEHVEEILEDGKPKLEIICPDHGPFILSEHTFLNYRGCRLCRGHHLRAYPNAYKNDPDYKRDKMIEEGVKKIAATQTLQEIEAATIYFAEGLNDTFYFGYVSQEVYVPTSFCKLIAPAHVCEKVYRFLCSLMQPVNEANPNNYSIRYRDSVLSVLDSITDMGKLRKTPPIPPPPPTINPLITGLLSK